MEQTHATTKKCKRCGQEKPLAEFNRKTASKDGYQTYCKECQTELSKRRMKSSAGPNPDLEPFTPRQLIEELRARGYRGELQYTYVVKV